LVSNVFPLTGSLNGGTKVTISGIGFDEEGLSVAFGGIPCHVEQVLYDQITCVTGHGKPVHTVTNRGYYPGETRALNVWPEVFTTS
jgi:hypothetical protein